MVPTRRLRSIGAVALALLLFTALPGMALADPSSVQPATSGPAITGLVKDSHGSPVAGIEVQAIGTVPGGNGSTTTAANGTFSMIVGGSDDYAVELNDPANWYLNGEYYTSGSGNFSAGRISHTDVSVILAPVAIDDVVIPLGKHITGTITGPGTPGFPLAGVVIQAQRTSPFYSTFTSTDSDGKYVLAVPSGSYSIGLTQWQGFYDSGCVIYSVTSVRPAEPDECTVVVGSDGLPGENFQMSFVEGVGLEIGPTGKTVAAGSGQAFTATLTGGRSGPEVAPDDKPVRVDISNVSAAVTFSINKGGTCSGASCTPPAAGDYTVTGTYDTLTATAVLHATAAPVTPVTPAPTPPPTATNGSSGGDGSPWFPLFLMALAAASVTLFTVHRPLARQR